MKIVHECGLCGSVYDRFGEMDRHMRTVHKGWFKCSQCNTICKTMYRLLKHVNQSHNRTVSIPCCVDDCCALFDNVKDRISHIIETHNLRKLIHGYIGGI